MVRTEEVDEGGSQGGEVEEREPGRPGPWQRARALGQRARDGLRSAAPRLVPSPAVRRGASWGGVAAALVVLGFQALQVRSQLGWGADLLLGLALALLVVAATAFGLQGLAWLLETVPRLTGWLGLGALVFVVGLLVSSSLPPSGILLFGGGLVLAGILLGGGSMAVLRGVGRFGRLAGVVALALGLTLAGFVAYRLADPGSAEHLVAADPAEDERLPEAPGEGASSPSLPGLSRAAVSPVSAEAARALERLGDPATPGPHPVEAFTYGAGDDLHREEFADGADWTSETVDARPFTRGYRKGWKRKLRDRYWGFGPSRYPLNGRGWAPAREAADGATPQPLPLILAVHGNHHMADYSDPGYAYLGEHLASRGMIFVSVDENFLNGSPFGGVPKENDARGWLLLRHLEQWRRWNEDPDHPFHGRVDLSRVGLLGHSRGGEAVGHAAAFNRLPAYPDDARVEFDFDFGIRALVAIAPSDGQYRPADRSTPLENVSYLVLQGGHDGDVSPFLGDRQYRRLKLDPDAPGGPYKASVYLYRANHGQFNTTWGNRDNSPPYGWHLNVAPLLAPEDQQRAATVLITAFLESTLGAGAGDGTGDGAADGRADAAAYRHLFRDLSLGAEWLPEDVYVSRYEDGSYRLLADFEEDLDVTTLTAPGGRARARGLARWSEGDIPLRDNGRREAAGVTLGWAWEEDADESQGAGTEEPPSYALILPESSPDPAGAPATGADPWAGPPGAEDLLVLDLARLSGAPSVSEEDDEESPSAEGDAEGEEAAEKDEEGEEGEGDADEGDKDEDEDEDEDDRPVDLSVELVDRSGTAVRLPLTRFGPPLRTLPSRFSKLDAIEAERYGDSPEPVVRTYQLPLAAFAAADPALDAAALTEIRLVFDRSPRGLIALDRVGFLEDQP